MLPEKLQIRHDDVLEQLRIRLSDRQLPAKYNLRDLDCFSHYQHHDYFFEIKTGEDMEAKARNAIGQLLQYKFFYRNEYPDPYLCVVLEKRPKENLIEFFEFIDVLLCWTTRKGFECLPYCRDALEFLL